MIPEKPGIYWIKIKSGNYYSGWIVGEYSEHCWEIIGIEGDREFGEVLQIGSEIVVPEDE